ncbi:hypothetical protein CES85_2874 (plasmid) [Ochrobactrum quorumnocens]|uniref:Uncharacterized protein n=1 Tax=Ochrobactrum quorumnocens TaxID=271865 RepID=A0A248UNX7_9HYPH|nr:hypothetical protein CES85_2874 [[Ochrobactrum] quorumnocens]
MNIAAIANFGARFGTRMCFALRRAIFPSQTYIEIRQNQMLSTTEPFPRHLS